MSAPEPVRPSETRTLAAMAHTLESGSEQSRLDRVLERLGDLVAYDAAAILQMLPGGPTLTVAPGVPASARPELLRELVELFRLITDDGDPMEAGAGGDAAPRDPSPHLALPLVSLEQVTGLIYVRRSAPEYSERDLGLVSVTAALVSGWLTMQRLRKVEAERVEALEAARAAAEAAARSKDEFLATVSHDLRTPLTAILGWIPLLRRSLGDGAKALQAIATIERNAQTQVRLVDDLLDASRIMAGKLDIDIQSVPLGPAVSAAAESIRPSAQAKSLELAVSVNAGGASIAADPDRLHQIIFNLLSNAVKFTPSGRRVMVRVERQGGEAVIAVQDEGAGIRPEALPHVFERFWQDERRSRARAGLGLGLSIVRHLVELHGGTVRAESPGEDGGSTFTVRLPLVAPERAKAPAAPTPEAAPLPLAGLRVLLVEDDPDASYLVSTVLEMHGAAVDTTATASDALRAIDRARPDVLLSDLGLRGEDGYALIEKVRARPAATGGGVPAAAVTARTSRADVDRVLAAGFAAHVAKPIDWPGLVMTVAKLTGRSVDPRRIHERCGERERHHPRPG